MSRSGRIVAVTAAAFLVLAALLFLPALTRDRVPVAVTGTPAPLADVSPLAVAPGQILCAQNVVFSPRGDIAEIVVDGRQTPLRGTLEVIARADGYAPPRVQQDVRATGLEALRFAVEPPDREAEGEFCVRNTGTRPAVLVGTAEARTRTHQNTTLNGDPLIPDMALSFYEDRTVSVISFLPDIAQYMTVFRGFLGATWLVWLLLAVVVIGVPAAMLTGLRRALADGR